jgi:hypothetical protein
MIRRLELDRPIEPAIGVVKGFASEKSDIVER